MGNLDSAGMSGFRDEEGERIAGFHGYIGWNLSLIPHDLEFKMASLFRFEQMISAVLYHSRQKWRNQQQEPAERVVGVVRFMEITRKAYREAKETNGTVRFSDKEGDQDALEKVVKSTCKDALEKGKSESIQNSEESTKQMIQSTIRGEETRSTKHMIQSAIRDDESMKEKECIAGSPAMSGS
ncbi:hypothetical protein OIU84_021666 [Salix udensis]|uniref:Uncharacterized protein n=1 Tax=Salix udensis TaxID=889485 RepID=A0AAD6KV50_9ROSI|nr:hypothetical protein OIU84_021666 [Salix udensis]